MTSLLAVECSLAVKDVTEDTPLVLGLIGFKPVLFLVTFMEDKDVNHTLFPLVTTTSLENMDLAHHNLPKPLLALKHVLQVSPKHTLKL